MRFGTPALATVGRASWLRSRGPLVDAGGTTRRTKYLKHYRSHQSSRERRSSAISVQNLNYPRLQGRTQKGQRPLAFPRQLNQSRDYPTIRQLEPSPFFFCPNSSPRLRIEISQSEAPPYSNAAISGVEANCLPLFISTWIRTFFKVLYARSPNDLMGRAGE